MGTKIGYEIRSGSGTGTWTCSKTRTKTGTRIFEKKI
jgi:hypothetical protein